MSSIFNAANATASATPATTTATTSTTTELCKPMDSLKLIGIIQLDSLNDDCQVSRRDTQVTKRLNGILYSLLFKICNTSVHINGVRV